MPEQQLYIAAYDIADASRLAAALKILLDYAVGRQKSVFECQLDTTSRAQLQQRMTALLDTEQDRFLMLPASRRSHWSVLGIAPEHDHEDYFFIG